MDPITLEWTMFLRVITLQEQQKVWFIGAKYNKKKKKNNTNTQYSNPERKDPFLHDNQT